MIIINHDYKIVIIIHKLSYNNNVKLIILRLNVARKQSPISEGALDIRIDIQPCKGNNKTTRHTWAMKAPWVDIVHDVIKESGQVLPRPSAIFHTRTSMGNPWVARTLSHITSVKRGNASSNSVKHEATIFVGPHKSCMHQYIINACSFRPNWSGP
jgi:hypothetical protein